MPNDVPKPKDFWDKFQSFFQVIAWIAIPIVLAFIGGDINSTLKDKEIKVQYIQLAVGILEDSPTADNANLRKWAIDIISAYSDVPIDQNTAKTLQQIPLPKKYYFLEDNAIRNLGDKSLLKLDR